MAALHPDLLRALVLIVRVCCKGDLLRPARFTMGTKPAGRAGQVRKAKQIQGTLQEVQVHGRGTVFNFAIML